MIGDSQESLFQRRRYFSSVTTTLVWSTIAIIFVIALWQSIVIAARGVSVMVNNNGPESINDVSIHVIGNSYKCGLLNPGESCKVHVHPNGESHVEISFYDTSAKFHNVVVKCYFDSHDFRGNVKVEIAENKILRVVDTTRFVKF